MTRLPAARRPLLVVAVCYHLRPEDFARRLRALVARHGFGLRGVVVSNNAEHPLVEPSDELRALRGTNRYLDFSGFFEGMEYLIGQFPEAESENVLFVNDSLITRHAGRSILRRVLSLGELLSQLRVPGIVGKFDPYRLICLRNPWSGHDGYISSYCFMLNSKALPVIRQLQSDAAAAGVFEPVPVHADAWGLGIPTLLRELIRAHLVYQGSPFIWPMTVKTEPELIARKAGCVYFEHRLSGVIGTSGALIPINMGLQSKLAIFLRETGSRLWRALVRRRV